MTENDATGRSSLRSTEGKTVGALVPQAAPKTLAANPRMHRPLLMFVPK
jgi:hypothetical protein